MCLLSLGRITDMDKDKSWTDSLKTGILWTNALLFKIYFNVRVNRLCSGIFPGKKMCAIGKFRRNILNFRENYNLAVYFICGSLINLFLNHALRALDLEPKLMFYIKFCFWVTYLDLPLLYLTITSSLYDLPSVKETPRLTKFYVYKPSFQPRRPLQEIQKLTNVEPLGYVSQANMSPYAMSKFKGKGKGKGKGKSTFTTHRIAEQLNQSPSNRQCDFTRID
jgi:hypothetical protein